MSAHALASALRAEGLSCEVEAFDRLAVIVPDERDPDVVDRDLRERVLSLARAHGFTHAAIELVEPVERVMDRAPLSRD